MIRRFINIVIAYALVALTIAVGFVRNQLDRLPVSIDRTVGSLDRIAVKLDRAEAQAMARANREALIQEASYDREDAAINAAQRAARVRDRVKTLLA